VIGSARDIVEELGVPRFLFTDLPLGNPIGPPNDLTQQRLTLSEAVGLAVSATAPRTTVHGAATWTGSDDWRETYMDLSNPDELRRLGEERRERQRLRKARQATNG